MIIRSYFECETCGHLHVVRIGMGAGEFQRHTFPCHECGQPMVIGLSVDRANVSAVPEAVENAILREGGNGTVVNVHADFVIPASERGQDFTFPHLKQMHEILVEADKQGRLASPEKFADRVGTRPFRPVDFRDEWKLLRKAWTLHRNDKEKLSQRMIEKGSETFYAKDPLDGLDDWLWRLTFFFGQPLSEKLFKPAFEQIKNAMADKRFTAFSAYYDASMSAQRATRYLGIIDEFFSGYSEFSQVYIAVATEATMPKDGRATSADFDSVRMFYGNAFEALSSSVDYLAFINNVLLNRDFDKFATMTKDQYLALDKASRFNAYALNPSFAALSSEADNQLRNASHHGGLHFDQKTQIISYQAGKGGTGERQEIAYVDYLARSTRMMVQIMTIFRLEIMMAHLNKNRMPI